MSPPPRKVKTLKEIYERATSLDSVSNFTLSHIQVEPQQFEDAVKHEVWIKAMDEEIDSIKRNSTWELTRLSLEKDVIGLKWVYKTKYKVDGSIERHKARLVAKAFAQQPCIDYNETYPHVARLDTIRTVLALKLNPSG